MAGDAMNEYPITVDEIVSWFLSKGSTLNDLGVTMANVCARRDTSKPSAFADFDTDNAIGRISAWVSGEFDFQVLRRSDGSDVLMRHDHVPSLDAPSLEATYVHFLRMMKHPSGTV